MLCNDRLIILDNLSTIAYRDEVSYAKSVWLGLVQLLLLCLVVQPLPPSGKSKVFLLTLEDAYRNLMMILSPGKLEATKPDHAWDKSSCAMNLLT
jgi:hypothetical protein